MINLLLFIVYSNLKNDSLSSALKEKVELKNDFFFFYLKTKRNNRRKEARDKAYTEREQEKEIKTRKKIRVREGAFEKGRKERKGKLISSALC